MSDTKPAADGAPEFETIGVIGAGQMGHGIAQVSAGAGYDVALYDVDRELAVAATPGAGCLDYGFREIRFMPGEPGECTARIEVDGE